MLDSLTEYQYYIISEAISLPGSAAHLPAGWNERRSERLIHDKSQRKEETLC